jgi:osmotically-inducible protein OsmY
VERKGSDIRQRHREEAAMDVHHMTDRLGGRIDDLRDRAAGALTGEEGAAGRELARTRRALDDLRLRIDDLEDTTADRIAALGDRLEGGGSWFGRLFWLLVGAGIGAGIAYVNDPQMGRTRRAQRQDQLGAQARDAADTARKRANYAAGVAQGAAVETVRDAFGDGRDDDVDPHTLRQRVQSEVIGHVDGALDVVVVVHNDHRVALKGRVRDPETEQRLVEATRQVRGVREVESELTTTG